VDFAELDCSSVRGMEQSLTIHVARS